MTTALTPRDRPQPFSEVLRDIAVDRPFLERFYKDLHAHPELSLQEIRTTARITRELRRAGLNVLTDLTETGAVAVLTNGPGPTVLLRADIDAVPVRELTGLPYASRTVTADSPERAPLMHACGHDMHVTWLMGAIRRLVAHRSAWQGSVVAVFQPAEENGVGAKALLSAGLATKIPRPDVVLGQHLMPLPAGTVGYRTGAIMASVDTLTVRLFGRGAHGSMPEFSVDPVVMAAALVMRLQGIVAREVGPKESAVVTVGQLHAGTASNVIPDHALLGLSVRSLDRTVRQRVLEAVERMVQAEAMASGTGASFTIRTDDASDVVVNSPEATARAMDGMRGMLGSSRVIEVAPSLASEDFGELGKALHAPSVFWFVGGVDPTTYAQAAEAGTLNEIPTNHSPYFAPVLHPTIETGVTALLATSCAWLRR